MSGDVLRQAELDAARLLLSKMGISPDELLATPGPSVPAPTFSEYVPGLVETVSPGSRKTHLTHWNRLVERWPNRPITEPTVTELESLREWTKTNAVQRSNGRGGVSAAENFVSAIRYLYQHAENDGLISAADNPARKVAKPPRRPSGRSAIAHEKLAEINVVVSSTGDDPDLDSLIIRLHTETAARRGGALALRPIDLDVEQGVIRLREKGGTVRWQPVSGTLMTHLVRHSLERRAPGREQLLRYRNFKPITYRRYDHLWARVRSALPWADAHQISNHWLRHTTLTWVERNFGEAVARAYAGHAEPKGDSGVTAVYVRANPIEVAMALAALTGERHPMCPDYLPPQLVAAAAAG